MSQTALRLALALALAAGSVGISLVAALPAHANSFIDDSHLQLHNRLLFERLDYQHGSTTRTVKGPRSDKAEEAAYGLMLNFTSGYTPGVVGFGVDAHAYGGINLGSDADTVRSNPRYVARDDRNLKNAFGRAGAVVKLRVSNTELKYGEMRTRNPIFHSSDTRLLPETNRGWLLNSKEIDKLALQAGRFTQWADRNARKNGGDLLANYSGVNGNSFTFAGANWTTPLAGLSLSGYYGRYQDVWNTAYLGGFYKLPLADKRALSFSLNLYRNTDTGKAKAGKVNNTTWSLMSSYAFGAHKLGLGYQKVDGDTPFDYVNRGSIWLENAMQLSDFNAPNEASWQLKYDVNLGQLLIPGLTAGVGYTRGSGIDYRRMNSVYANYLGATGAHGKHWERDLIVRYTVQDGKAKGLALQLRYSSHRANKDQGELDANQIRVAVELPLEIF